MLILTIKSVIILSSLLKSELNTIINKPIPCRHAPGVMSPSCMKNSDWSANIYERPTVPKIVIKVPEMNRIMPNFLSCSSLFSVKSLISAGIRL